MLVSSDAGTLFSRYPTDIAMKMFADAGFEALDFSAFGAKPVPEMFEPFHGVDIVEKALEMRKYAESLGLTFNQSHAPFPQSIAGNEELFRIVSALGAKTMIVHPIHNVPYHGNEEKLYAYNLEYYKSLLPLAEKYGVRICTENMWRRDPLRKVIIDSFATPLDMMRLYDEISSPFFGICLDIGHCLLTSWDIPDTVRMLGKRLTALHIHDNDGRDDKHIALGFGITDIDGFVSALSDAGYSGDFTVEAGSTYGKCPEYMVKPYLSFIAQSSRGCRDRFLALKEEKKL